MIKDKYLDLVGFKEIPKFLIKYLSVPALLRLKNVGYFCGMDYASKDVYDFPEYISRFDHSLVVALLTWKYTKDMKSTLAALFHDVSTPCFSHVIDYMNKDYKTQESTEEYTSDILSNEKYLLKCLDEDNISLEDLDFKKYNIVDNDRPKLCTDRLDGVIMTALFWTKDLKINDVEKILNDINVYKNEYNEDEIGFKSESILKFVLNINEKIDIFCHSKEDNYMMELLANITRNAINKNIISYEDLYKLTERELFNIFENSCDEEILNEVKLFKEVKVCDIPDITLSDVKKRVLKPLVSGKRI